MIGIIGQGFVGNAIYQKFKTYFKVFTYDLDSSTKSLAVGCSTYILIIN